MPDHPLDTLVLFAVASHESFEVFCCILVSSICSTNSVQDLDALNLCKKLLLLFFLESWFSRLNAVFFRIVSFRFGVFIDSFRVTPIQFE